MAHPLDVLRYHVTGAIERGEAAPIVGQAHDDKAKEGTVRNQIKRPQYYTFKIFCDRGPDAWGRYTTETQQFGPCASEEEAREALRATRGDEAAGTALLVRRD